jgi:hypothetical protein
MMRLKTNKIFIIKIKHKKIKTEVEILIIKNINMWF